MQNKYQLKANCCVHYQFLVTEGKFRAASSTWYYCTDKVIKTTELGPVLYPAEKTLPNKGIPILT